MGKLFSVSLGSIALLATACTGAPNPNQADGLNADDFRSIPENDLQDSLAFGSTADSDNPDKVIFTWKDSGKVIDGKGRAFNDGKVTMVEFNSVFVDGQWKYPENITFKNWRLKGGLRVIGVGPSSDTDLVKKSSRSLGHTKRMRDAAPRGITFQNLLLETDYKIPFVIGPGAHLITFENSIIAGKSRSVAVYLDAESGENTFRNNIFNLRASREVMAVDGSASNKIVNNIFIEAARGGIHIYRNSGERGVVRHQKPQFNEIRNNYFNGRELYIFGAGVFLGSRNSTNPNYRDDDNGFDFGSSISNRDYARNNIVQGNLMSNDGRQAGSIPFLPKSLELKFFVRTTEEMSANEVRKNRLVEPIRGVSKIISEFEKKLQMPDLSQTINK